MSLSKKTVLLISDDSDVVASVKGALEPLVKIMHHSTTAADAFKRLGNSSFDAYILRTKAAALKDPRHIYAWTQGQKDYQTAPWIVLGKDIEDEAIVVSNDRVKFLNDPTDAAGLVKVLNGLFYVPPAESAPTAAAGAAAGLPKGPDVSFINPLVGAVVDVIRTMAKLELQKGVPYLKRRDQASTFKADVSGIIAMNSDRFTGSMAVSMGKPFAMKLYERIVGAPAPDLNDDVKDAVSELTNIIFGNAKRDLNNEGHTLAPAIPSVVSGTNHDIRHSVDGHCFCIPFTSEFGPVLVECVMSAKNSESKAPERKAA